MSPADRPVSEPELPPAWGRLEDAAREAAASLVAWRRRALEAEDEATRLHRALEDLARAREPSGDGASAEHAEGIGALQEEIRRLRAENVALRSRMAQARRRVATLLKRLTMLQEREG